MTLAAYGSEPGVVADRGLIRGCDIVGRPIQKRSATWLAPIGW
jgi:hypothetical protein